MAMIVVQQYKPVILLYMSRAISSMIAMSNQQFNFDSKLEGQEQRDCLFKVKLAAAAIVENV